MNSKPIHTVLLFGILFAGLFSAAQILRAACNVDGSNFTELEIGSVDWVGNGTNVEVTVTVTGPAGSSCSISLADEVNDTDGDSLAGDVTISPTNQTFAIPMVYPTVGSVSQTFTVSGVSASDTLDDVKLVAEILDGEDTTLDPVMDCFATEYISVINVDIEQVHTNVCYKTNSAALNLTTNSFLGSGTANWSSVPSGISGSGTDITYDPSSLTPTQYIVTAVSSILPGCMDTCVVDIVKIDIEQVITNVYFDDALVAQLNLTPDSYWTSGTVWSINTNGLGSIDTSVAGVFKFSPTNSTPGQYVVTAYDQTLTNCMDVATVNVGRVSISIDLVDKEPDADADWDASGLDLSSITVLVNSNLVSTNLMTFTDIMTGSLIVGKKLEFNVPGSHLDSTGANTVSVDVQDNVTNEMSQITGSFVWP